MGIAKFFVVSNYLRFFLGHYIKYRNSLATEKWPLVLPYNNVKISNSLDFSLLSIAQRYNLHINGLIQVGAHKGQELEGFIKYGVEHMILIEPVPDHAKIIKEKIGVRKNIKVVSMALGASKGLIKLNITSNDGQSSSILDTGFNFRIASPEIRVIQSIEVEMTRMDNVIENFDKYNTLLIDVEGYELEVLKGSTETLKFIDHIFIEVNKNWVRKGNPTIHKIDKILLESGFKRIFTRWWDFWGDAFYTRF